LHKDINIDKKKVTMMSNQREIIGKM